MNYGCLLMLLLIWIVLWLGSSLAVDRFIKYLYDYQTKTWEAIGKPRGMFFHPKGSSYVSYARLSYYWEHELPVLIPEDQIVKSHYARIMIWKKWVTRYLILFLPLVTLGEFM